MIEAVWIGFAFLLGLLIKQVGLPPLIGYLAAGFAIFQFSGELGMPANSSEILNHIAHLGVLLLLFTVGLKLNPKKVMKSEVIGTGVLHMAFSVAIFTPVIYFVTGVELMTAVMLSTALSFSSTVLVAKVLESKQELRAFHGRVAIGILIVQDLLALAVMSIASGKVPSVWALGIFALPLLRPLLFKLMDASGHDELLILFGLVFALIVGGAGFEAVGLSSELGALVFGALLASHPRAPELSNKLWAIKEFFLVGFFLTIGMNGLPDANAWIFAVVVVALLPLQGVVFFMLLTGFKLKARSAFLTSASLTNFSEFGLIVAAVLMPEWIVPLALSVALSFLVSAPLNRFAHPLFDRLEGRLGKWERQCRHPDEEPISLGDAEVLIMGMGRLGQAAYEALGSKSRVIGLDSDQDVVKRLSDAGKNVLYADAEHGNFWGTLDLTGLKSCVLSMSCPEASEIAARKLREFGYQGYLVAHSAHQDDADRIERAGADKAYLTITEAGEGLAYHVLEDGLKRSFMPEEVDGRLDSERPLPV